MNKYQIAANEYKNDFEFSMEMECLAGDYIKENELNIEIDDLWNDCTADQARASIDAANGGMFYADDFFTNLISGII